MYSADLLLADKMGNCGDRRILARKDCFLQAKNNDWIRVFLIETEKGENWDCDGRELEEGGVSLMLSPERL